MKTPVGLRPAAWEPRQRLIAAAVAAVVVLIGAVWWIAGTDGRRAGAACDLYYGQQAPLRTTVSEVTEAAERARDAEDTTVIGYFNNINRELNTLRRWQSTMPRVEKALGDTADSDGSAAEAARTMDVLDGGVAEMQRLVEEGTPTANLDWIPELQARLQMVDDTCGRL